MLMGLEKARDEFVQHVRLYSGKGGEASPHTVTAYKRDLTLFITHVRHEAGHERITAFTPEVAENWLAWMQDKGLARATLARRQTTLFEFAKWGLRKRLWSQDPTLEMRRITVPERMPRPFDPDETERLMRVDLPPDEDALRAVLYYGGLREAEVCGLRGRDLRRPSVQEDGTLGAARLRVLGKGNKERVVSLHDDCWAALGRHMATKADEDRTLNDFVFSQRYGLAWSPYMIWVRVKAWGEAAGVESCTPHRFRHTFCTDQLEATDGDIRTVGDQAGHARISTTQGYTKLADRRRDAAARKMRSFRPVIPSDYPGGETGAEESAKTPPNMPNME
jgi:site-specific recombinase XerC